MRGGSYRNFPLKVMVFLMTLFSDDDDILMTEEIAPVELDDGVNKGRHYNSKIPNQNLRFCLFISYFSRGNTYTLLKKRRKV